MVYKNRTHTGNLFTKLFETNEYIKMFLLALFTTFGFIAFSVIHNIHALYGVLFWIIAAFFLLLNTLYNHTKRTYILEQFEIPERDKDLAKYILEYRGEQEFLHTFPDIKEKPLKIYHSLRDEH